MKPCASRGKIWNFLGGLLISINNFCFEAGNFSCFRLFRVVGLGAGKAEIITNWTKLELGHGLSLAKKWLFWLFQLLIEYPCFSLHQLTLNHLHGRGLKLADKESIKFCLKLKTYWLVLYNNSWSSYSEYPQ